MSEGRRRTSFEKDLREVVLKVFLGFVVGTVIKVTTGFEGWWPPIIVGVVAVFWLASAIRGDSYNADKG